MAHRVRLHVDFRDDVEHQLEWIMAHRPEWRGGLREGIAEAMELLEEWPAVGTVEGRDGARRLRKLILRRVPFVVWFATDGPSGDADVWLLRLFHARQDRPVGRKRRRRSG